MEYLTAQEIADRWNLSKRTVQQLCAAGRPAEYGDVLREVNERDERDMNRAVSPLRRAEDAYLIDSSDMTIDEVVDAILNRVAQARARS